jgi:hypothetical protein
MDFCDFVFLVVDVHKKLRPNLQTVQYETDDHEVIEQIRPVDFLEN